jgi:cytochrome c oxidase subunit 1
MSAVVDTHGHGHGHDHAGHAHGHGDPHGGYRGLMRWVTTTNHKDIGTMYLWFAGFMFFVGGMMALAIRLELFHPGLQYLHPDFYNQLVTSHGLIMIFGAIMPAFVGFANWQIPMMIGAPDMAFARLNNWSFWLLPFAATLLISAYFMPGGAPGAGWTLYAPLTVQQGIGMDFTIFAIHILGMSSILGSINIITTILNMRAPGMTMMKMPMFCWTWLITAYLLVAVMPVLAGAVTMTLTDRHFGTTFFNAAGGGDPVLYQHIFWFFGHPEVYVIALPAFGVISQVIPAFSRKPLFGYASMVYATSAIAILSFIVWAHHMYTVGMPVTGQLFFMYETPMLFACGFLFLFTLGGFTGLVLSLAPVDIQLQDTYYVVAHFHYVMVAGAMFSAFAGIYFWLPKWTGKMYNETLGKWHFWLTLITFNLIFFVQHFLGMAGMPRRIPDYPLMFTTWNEISSIGAFGFALSQLVFLYNLFTTLKRGEPAPQKPWDGADSLDWTHLPTPAPYHSFETAPQVK